MTLSQTSLFDVTKFYLNKLKRNKTEQQIKVLKTFKLN